MQLVVGRDAREAGSLAGRFSRRSAARQDEAGPPRTCSRSSTRRCRRSTTRSRAAWGTSSPSLLYRPPYVKTSRITPTRDADAAVRQQLVDQLSAANPFDVPPELGLAAHRRLRAGLPGARRGSRQVPLRVPPGRRASGAARPDHRHDRRNGRAQGHARPTSTSAWPTSPPSAAPIPARCTRRCRRPAGCARSSRASPKTKCSPGSWNGEARVASVPDSHRHQTPPHDHHLSAVCDRALAARRAELRHLQPSADGPHHLPRHAGQRRRREHRHRPDVVSRGRQPGPRHLPLHQLAGRQRVGGARDLRHDAVHEVAGEHDLHGTRREHGRVPARRRPQGQAVDAPAFANHDSPTLTAGGRRIGVGHRDPGEGDPVPPRAR